MKSPFPGMDPYLERHWGDVHSTLVVFAREQINEQLPSDLQARVEETIAVSTDDSFRVVYPDVRVIEQPKFSGAAEAKTADVAVAEPHVVLVPCESPTLRHIEIIDSNSGNRVVTAIEVLSPANKCSVPGRHAFRKKQREYFNAEVNIVEIDFIRRGKFVMAIPEGSVPQKCKSTYLICIRRVNRPDYAELVPISLREPLPNIRIPLRPTDSDIVLQLQPLIDQCYQSGRYQSIDYRRPPEPPLKKSDEQWADELLRSKGFR